MLKKWKGILSVFICVLMLCTVMPITGHAADNAASVTFGGNTENYTTIDAAWTAAVALDTTAENKATIKLLTNCKTENTLTNTADYLVLDTNGKTLTTPDAIHNENNILCGISVEGGNLEIIGNGTITGLSSASYARGILRITGGEAYANGVTIHNTGLNGSNAVVVNGGSFHLLDGYLLSDSEYALDALSGKVYLYSGKIESTGRLAAAFDYSLSNVQICYSDKPLYFVDNDTNNWSVISNVNVQLADNLIMDLEYSDNPDGSDSKTLKNVTEIDATANTNRNYLKIQTYKPSYLFSTNYNSQLLKKIKEDGVTALTEDAFTAVHFVDLADYDMTNITYSDYSSKNDGSVKAWVNGTELYIGGYGKIIAGRSLSCALRDGKKIDSITGLELLDTSKTTDMGYLFNYCGSESTVFTLDLGDGFDTSKVTDMTYMFLYCGKNSTKFALNLGKNFDTSNVTKMGSMFYGCGYSSPTFTLDLGDKFDTSKVTYMYQMFQYCGKNSKAFTTLDLSTFTVGADTTIDWFADSIPVTKFIFGKGWRNAALPAQYTYFARCSSNTPTEIVGATKNLLSYDWTRDNRTVTFTDNTTYTITPAAEDGGTVSGGGTVLDGESITLTAAASDGYSFDGWYDGDTKVCDTEKFVIEDAADDKTYTAKFATYYTVSAEVGTGGGTVSGGGKVAKGTSITLTATANEGYTFDGWYDGDTKVCDTVEFVVDNVTADKTYTAKFTEKIQKTSKLFSTDMFFKLNTVLAEDIEFSTPIKIISFVDLNDYDLEGITTSDYSADLDGSVLAWYDEATFTLYIGGYGKIIAGRSLAHAFAGSIDLNRITGLDMLDTSNVTDMEEMFSDCGRDSKEFTLDLGDNFDTSNVTNMKGMFDDCGALTLDLGNKFDTSKVTNMYGMFYGCVGSPSACTLDLGDKFDTSNVTNMGYLFSHCGSSSKAFTLNLGDKFDTSNVTHMEGMFSYCGRNSRAFALDLGDKFDTSNVTDMRGMFTYCGEYCPSFSIEFGDKFDTSNVTDMSEMFSNGSKSLTTLDLSTFNVGENTKLDQFAYNTSVNTFIFGDGWKNATLPSAGRTSGAFYNYSQTDSTVIGATENLCNYDWASDNRIVNGLKPQTYTVTANAETGGTVSGGGTVIESSSITLTATANEGYTFDGWYDGDTKVCDTAEFVVDNVTADKTYTAKFTKNAVSYTISAEVDANGGGTVSGGGEVAAGGSITLTASANDGYTFDGWYDGDTKVCDTTEFVVTNVAADKTYTAKFTKTVSRLFSTSDFTTLLSKIKTDGITTYKCDQITAVHFVDLAEQDLTDIKYSDYSANRDGSVKAWMDGTELYIGGYGTIIAGERLRSAFWHGDKINSITGLEMLDTSNVTDMSFMFYACGYSADVFTLDLGDTFNTSNVTDMSYMFYYCGYNCDAFTLDLGANFDTSKVTNMEVMFFRCGDSSKAFTTLDLSTFKVNADTNLSKMAREIPVTTFIFGDGWASAKLPAVGSSTGAFYTESETDTTIVGATENLLNYNWASDNRTVTFTDKSNFKITANAQTGGTVSGGGEVAAGGSITLTATVNDGYTFAGWYDGDTKVCDTAEFVVTNVAADKTYTAKFTKNQVDPEPEPEEPEIPYLKWDGSTLTLVKKTSASCRVGIVYVGGATFDADNINWDKLVSAGKEYANLNSAVGYAVYSNFTKRTPGTRGNYVAFVKYTKDDGTTTADYITFNVKDAVSFEIPSLSYNVKTKTLKLTGDVASTIGVAYVGDAEFNASNLNWNDFIKAGKQYTDVNGSSGYAKVLNTLDYTKTLTVNGNYVAFVKYNDENINKTLAKYYTFTVSDYEPQPEDVPYVSAQDNKIVLAASGLEVAKVTIAYIGTDDIYITNWSEFSAAAAKFSDINGKALNQQYTNPKDGSAWKQKLTGWYAVYIRYIKDGEKCNSYYTVELN